MNVDHAHDYEEWGWIHIESMPGEFKIEISENGQEMICGSPDVHIGRGKIGLIKVWLQDHSGQGFELVRLIFEDDKRRACKQDLLKKEILIIDDNRRDDDMGEDKIKFSVIARSRNANKALYLDPRIINE